MAIFRAMNTILISRLLTSADSLLMRVVLAIVASLLLGACTPVSNSPNMIDYSYIPPNSGGMRADPGILDQ